MADLEMFHATKGGQRQSYGCGSAMLIRSAIVTAPVPGDMPQAPFLSINATGVSKEFY
ncbi:MAG: hypothetical protein ACNA7M_14225 [Roseovarius sp.]